MMMKLLTVLSGANITPGGAKDAILLAGGASGGILMADSASDILMAGQ